MELNLIGGDVSAKVIDAPAQPNMLTSYHELLEEMGDKSHADRKGKAPTLEVRAIKTPDSPLRINDELFIDGVVEALLEFTILPVHIETMEKRELL